ncbi:hypothetical protein IFR05_015505 [Cadophora sp. M221]|nr:hypothetical protein IFR05_015505 [Cadophora sp. M221]
MAPPASGHEHAARNDMPAFVSIIDYENDSLNLTQRGEFTNPQLENAEHGNQDASDNRYVYEHDDLLHIKFNYDSNFLVYALHHYPEICMKIRRVRIRSCYITWLGKMELFNGRLSMVGFFGKHFGALERVGVVSTGVGEDVDSAERWAGDEGWRDAEEDRDWALFVTLDRASEMGRLKYRSAGDWV